MINMIFTLLILSFVWHFHIFSIVMKDLNKELECISPPCFNKEFIVTDFNVFQNTIKVKFITNNNGAFFLDNMTKKFINSIGFYHFEKVLTELCPLDPYSCIIPLKITT